MNNNIRKNIILVSGGFILLVAILSVLYLVVNSKNTFGDELQIGNLSSYTRDLPQDEEALNLIKNNLYEVVDRNNPGTLESNSIDDILIREDTFDQTFDDRLGVYYVEFIVDIESLQQSYLVNYQWADSVENQVNLDQYGTMVSCLPVDMLVYGDFPCEDTASDMGDTYEPYLVANWESESDQYGNSVASQLQPHELAFIEGQVIGDYIENNNVPRLNVFADIFDINREVDSSNSLQFTLFINRDNEYSVSIDYNDGRLVRIVNNTTGKVIERRT